MAVKRHHALHDVDRTFGSRRQWEGVAGGHFDVEVQRRRAHRHALVDLAAHALTDPEAPDVVAFERDMPKRYAWADLAICRAGALTVAELALAGMPSLLVPYPFAADDHQAAQSIGIPLNRIWVIVWSVAGFVALVAGIIWGSKLGVQFSLSLVALKALPVVILGGLTSVPGAIVGGLIIGVGEKLSEVFIGPYFGGGIEIWFAYVLALVFLLFRPQGLFGEKIIDRV